MNGRFTDKAVLVTGGSSGIGKACAERLGREGARVVINGRDPAKLDAAVAELRAQGTTVAGIAADLTEPDTAQRLVQGTVEAYGRIDAVIGNIGLIGHHGPPLQTDRESFEQAMSGNTWPCIALLRSAIDAGMGRGGAMVNISALAARKLLPSVAAYGASKGALEILTRMLALDVGPLGIRVNAVCPGLIETPATAPMLDTTEKRAAQSRPVPLGRVGKPRDIASAVAFLLADEADYITGVVLDVDGGALLSSVGFDH